MKTLRFFGLALMTILLGVSFASCSDDDDPAQGDNPNQGGDINIGVPPSVVDGVRPAEISGMKINYNEDGTINTAEVDGTVFTFNYSRGATQPLNSITAKNSDGEATESWKADNFTMSNNGFISGYKLTYNMEEPRYNWWEKEETTYKISYRDGGLIEKIDMKGTYSDSEDGPYPGAGSYSYTYDQSGKLREIKGVQDGFTFFEQKLEYTQDYDNKYNTMLLTLTPEDIVSGDPVFQVLAVTGLLGNTSKKLPTKAVLNYTDPEDPEDNSTEILELDYNISANGVINWYSVNGQKYNCKFVDADYIIIE